MGLRCFECNTVFSDGFTIKTCTIINSEIITQDTMMVFCPICSEKF